MQKSIMFMLDLNLETIGGLISFFLCASLGTRMLGLSPSALGTNKDTVSFPFWPLRESHAVDCTVRQELKRQVNTSQLLLLAWGRVGQLKLLQMKQEGTAP